MKSRISVLVVALMFVGATAQTGLWIAPIDNAGFEADGVTTGWANYTTDWFDSDYWDTFLIPAGDGSGPYPEAVEGVSHRPVLTVLVLSGSRLVHGMPIRFTRSVFWLPSVASAEFRPGKTMAV